jgi:hypothetical protein
VKGLGCDAYDDQERPKDPMDGLVLSDRKAAFDSEVTGDGVTDGLLLDARDAAGLY